VPAGPTGPWRRPLRPIRDLLEGVRLAEEVGLDFFGVGEHRSLSMPVSAPGTFLAAAAVTSRIGLGSTGVEEDRNRILR
jgi:alkanesulfonate monooxygenase SsuD/methylene tetrahydromethanopterin reductase-like flavin-dependent oxidoreductase (luciferase family)